MLISHVWSVHLPEAFIVSGRCRITYLSDRLQVFFFRLLLAFEIWKKETYAYETATDLIRFQLHGWAQSSAATDAPLILQIRETSCIHEYDEYADKCFTVMYSHVYVMHTFFF